MHVSAHWRLMVPSYICARTTMATAGGRPDALDQSQPCNSIEILVILDTDVSEALAPRGDEYEAGCDWVPEAGVPRIVSGEPFTIKKSTFQVCHGIYLRSATKYSPIPSSAQLHFPISGLGLPVQFVQSNVTSTMFGKLS